MAQIRGWRTGPPFQGPCDRLARIGARYSRGSSNAVRSYRFRIWGRVGDDRLWCSFSDPYSWHLCDALAKSFPIQVTSYCIDKGFLAACVFDELFLVVNDASPTTTFRCDNHATSFPFANERARSSAAFRRSARNERSWSHVQLRTNPVHVSQPVQSQHVSISRFSAARRRRNRDCASISTPFKKGNPGPSLCAVRGFPVCWVSTRWSARECAGAPVA